MKPTQEQAKYFLPFVQALAEGKKIECKSKTADEWSDAFDRHDEWFTSADFVVFDFRIKPEPKLRPWKAEEVPVGSQVRAKNEPRNDWRWLVIAVSSEGIYVGVVIADNLKAKYIKLDFSYCCERFEHSLDQGKTWLPCGVMEE